MVAYIRVVIVFMFSIVGLMHIGVTGHRKLTQGESLVASITVVLEELRALARWRPGPTALTSPLAEGADRLVARTALAIGQIELRVLLPLAREDYVHDFGTAASRWEFASLLDQATAVETMPASGSRAAAYLAVGEELVRRCDVIVAIWDGQPPRGRGGTAEVVEMARSRGRPLVWVHSEEAGSIVRERLAVLTAAPPTVS